MKKSLLIFTIFALLISIAGIVYFLLFKKENTKDFTSNNSFLHYNIEEIEKAFSKEVDNSFKIEYKTFGIQGEKAFVEDDNSNKIEIYIEGEQPKRIVCFEEDKVYCAIITTKDNNNYAYYVEVSKTNKTVEKVQKLENQKMVSLGLIEYDSKKYLLLKDEASENYIINNLKVVRLSEFLNNSFNALIYKKSPSNIRINNDSNYIYYKEKAIINKDKNPIEMKKYVYSYDSSKKPIHFIVDESDNLFIIEEESLENGILEYSNYGKVQQFNVEEKTILIIANKKTYMLTNN